MTNQEEGLVNLIIVEMHEKKGKLVFEPNTLSKDVISQFEFIGFSVDEKENGDIHVTDRRMSMYYGFCGIFERATVV